MEAAHPLSAALHRAPVPLLPQPSPQGAAEVLAAHLAAPRGGVVGDTGSVSPSDLGACGERGPVNCFPLGGCAGRHSCACGRERRIELRPEAATWLCCLGDRGLGLCTARAGVVQCSPLNTMAGRNGDSSYCFTALRDCFLGR